MGRRLYVLDVRKEHLQRVLEARLHQEGFVADSPTRRMLVKKLMGRQTLIAAVRLNEKGGTSIVRTPG